MYSKIWQAGKCRTVRGSSQDGAERIAENKQEVMAQPILGWSWVSHGDQGRTVPVVSFKKKLETRWNCCVSRCLNTSPKLPLKIAIEFVDYVGHVIPGCICKLDW